MGRAQGKTSAHAATAVSRTRSRTAVGEAPFDVRKRLGELRPPKEFIEFLHAWGDYYRENDVNTAEIVAAIPDGADLVAALDKTALWLLTDKTHGVASMVPKDSPNQKPLRALAKLLRRRIAGEYVDGEDFGKVQMRFIFDTTWPGSVAEHKELTGLTVPVYKAGVVESAAIEGTQLVLADPSIHSESPAALSWFADGDGSAADHGFEASATTDAAYRALLDAFKASVAAA
jgi:hypothetical protein